MKSKGRIFCAQIDEMQRHFFLLITCFLFSSFTFGQKTSLEVLEDSIMVLVANAKHDTLIVNYLAELSTKARFTAPQKALDYANQSLALSKSIDYSDGIIRAYGDLFNGHFYKGSNADSLRRYAALLKEQFQILGDSIGMIEAYWDYAMYYGNVGQPDKEIDAYQQALRLIRKYTPSEMKEAQLLTNIGGVFFSQYRAKKALEYFNLSLSMEQPPISKGYALANKGNVYHILLNKIEEAQQYYEEALEIFMKEDELGGRASVLVQRGAYFDTLGQLDIAYEMHNEALRIAQENGLNYTLPDIYQGFASHYRKKKEYKKAIEFGEKARAEVQSQSFYYQIEPVFKTLYKCYLKVEDYKSAHIIGEELNRIQDSIANLQMMNTVAELNTAFEVQKKENDNKILQERVNNRTVTSIALVLGLILVGSWAIHYYRSNKRKQKYNEELEAKVQERTEEVQKTNVKLERNNEELRTFNYIASHDLKGPIRGIGNYIQLIERKLPDNLKAETENYFDVVNSSTTRLYTLLEDISKYSRLSNLQDVAKESIDLNELVEQIEVENAETIQKYRGKIIYQELPIISSSHSLVFTIFKNLIENGLKFNQSETPTVKIDHQLKNGHHEFTFLDNGIGIDSDYFDKIFVMFKRLQNRQEYEGTGIGLAIVKLLTNKIDGQIEVKSEPQQGSQFTIKIPV